MWMSFAAASFAFVNRCEWNADIFDETCMFWWGYLFSSTILTLHTYYTFNSMFEFRLYFATDYSTFCLTTKNASTRLSECPNGWKCVRFTFIFAFVVSFTSPFFSLVIGNSNAIRFEKSVRNAAYTIVYEV